MVSEPGEGGAVGFGVVGLGGRAQTLIKIVRDHPRARLVHLCDAKGAVVEKQRHGFPPEEAARLTFSTDYATLLADPVVEAVVITTPDGTHERLAVAAFDAGKHVFLEKPVGITLEEMSHVLATAVSSGKQFQVGYQGRHIPFFKSVKQILDRGEAGPVGRPLFVQANELYYGGYHYFRSWWRFKENTGGVMVQKICHDCDLMYWYFGRPARVSCFGSNMEFAPGNAPTGSTARLCRDCPPDQHCPYYIQNDDTVSTKTDQCVYNADHDVVDNTQVLIQFESGLVATIGMHFFPSKAQNSRFLKISGSKGDLWGKVKEDFVLVNPRFDRTRDHQHGFMYQIPPARYPPAKHLFDALIAGITTGTPVEPGVEGAYWSMLLVVGAQRAMETRQVVEIQDLVAEYPFPRAPGPVTRDP